MAHDYQSFLVRCWQLGDGTRRIAIEHVQSGERTLVASLDAATAWLNTCVEEARPGAAPATDEPASPLAYPPRPPGGGQGSA
jgi:hypothetical protein